MLGAVKWGITRSARRLGYVIHKLPPAEPVHAGPAPPPVEPVWPLPRRREAIGDAELAAAFAEFPHWHYAYAFDGGARFGTAHVNPGLETDNPVRPLQRFRHFMPYLVEAAGGSLKGKRVLDIACNGGFWSIQCALMGAEVTGFDAREELVAQARLVARACGADTAGFRRLDFDAMTPEGLGGTFDIVLNLGLLYHLPDPLAALARTREMTHGHILLDTALHPDPRPLVALKWEEPFDIRMAAAEGMVAAPSEAAVEMMLRHLGLTRSLRIPVRSRDIPDDYRRGLRAAWLIEP